MIKKAAFFTLLSCCSAAAFAGNAIDAGADKTPRINFVNGGKVIEVAGVAGDDLKITNGEIRSFCYRHKLRTMVTFNGHVQVLNEINSNGGFIPCELDK